MYSVMISTHISYDNFICRRDSGRGCGLTKIRNFICSGENQGVGVPARRVVASASASATRPGSSFSSMGNTESNINTANTCTSSSAERTNEEEGG